MAKKRINNFKFRESWLTNNEFKDWIDTDQLDPNDAFCIYCECTIKSSLSHLRAHAANNKHQQNLNQHNTSIENDEDEEEEAEYGNENNSKDLSDTVGNQEKRSKKRYEQKIRDDWFQMPEFRDWLQISSDSRAFCRYCETTIKPKVCGLRAHATTTKHQKRQLKRLQIMPKFANKSEDQIHKRQTTIANITDENESGNANATTNTNTNTNIKRKIKKNGKVIIYNKKYYVQKIRNSWFHMPEFKDWIQRDLSDCTRAYCSYCNCSIKSKLFDLRAHAKAAKHQRRAANNFIANENHYIADDDDDDEYKNLADPEENEEEKEDEEIFVTLPPDSRCRICLNESNDKMISLFGNNDEGCSQVLNKLEEIGGISLLPHPDLPNMLCLTCKETLNIAYNFRQQIQKNQNILMNSNIDPIAATLDGSKENNQSIKPPIVEGIAKISTNQPIKSIDESKLKSTSSSSSRIEYENDEKEDDDLITAQSSIMCNICGKLYSNISTLNTHMRRRHLPEQQFKCEICEERFLSSAELRNHLREHTGENPFKCKYCQRIFSDRNAKLRHERTHANEPPLCCICCGKTFTYPNALKKHMLTHSAIEPSICSDLIQDNATMTHETTAAHALKSKHNE